MIRFACEISLGLADDDEEEEEGHGREEFANANFVQKHSQT